MPDPFQTPIQTRPTPVSKDTLFWEWVKGVDLDGVRLEYGSQHPDTRNFSNFLLCKEERENLATGKRWWANALQLQDTYNDNISYQEGDPSYPVIKRRNVVLRTAYTELAKGSRLSGIIIGKVTNPGSGYASAPVVTFSGGTGSGDPPRALINESGQVCAIIIEDEGTWTVAPALVFTGGDGSGAAGTVTVQSQSAILTRQQKAELPADDPRASIFVIQELTYEVLPGPTLSKPGFDPQDGGLTDDYTQRVALPASAIAKGTEYPASSGYYVEESYVQPDEGEGAVAGTLIVKTKKLPTPVNALGLASLTGSFKPIYETDIDTTTNIIVDIVKQVVRAGTQGAIIPNNAKNITITTGNPTAITTDVAHGFISTDSVKISGVSGNVPAINGPQTVTVLDELTFTIPVHTTVAGTGGTAYRTSDPDGYVEVKAIGTSGMLSLSIRSAVRASSVLADAGWQSYPLSQEWQMPPAYTAPVEILSTDSSGNTDIGIAWEEVGQKEGEFKGWASEGYFTKAQLDAWANSSYPALTYKTGGGSQCLAFVGGSGGRVFTFHVPLEQLTIPGGIGPMGLKVRHVRGEQLHLGLFRVTILESNLL